MACFGGIVDPEAGTPESSRTSIAVTKILEQNNYFACRKARDCAKQDIRKSIRVHADTFMHVILKLPGPMHLHAANPRNGYLCRLVWLTRGECSRKLGSQGKDRFCCRRSKRRYQKSRIVVGISYPSVQSSSRLIEILAKSPGNESFDKRHIFDRGSDRLSIVLVKPSNRVWYL